MVLRSAMLPSSSFLMPHYGENMRNCHMLIDFKWVESF